MLIKVKNYEHYNSAMGKYITSRKHYEEEMARGGYTTFEKAEEIAEKARKQKKPYEISEKAKEIIKTAYQIKDKKGNVRVSDRMIDGMKEVGVNFYNSNIPKHYATDKGGFDAT